MKIAFLLLFELKDSIFALDKMGEIETLRLEQRIAEIENMEREERAQQSRKHNLEYAGIGIALLTIIIFFLALSNSFIVKTNFVRFFGLITLLLAFEFINLLTHPFVSDLTAHSPILIFLIMACLAAALVPLHHSLEKWITHHLVEKNKRVRLIAAKKTIKELEA